MNKNYLGALLAVAIFTAATAAQAAIHHVYPGESIQAAIDAARSGDTILVEPGVYKEKANDRYGLRITENNLRLIGMVRQKKGQGKPNKVRLLQHKRQETGILAAPAGCEYDMTREECEDAIEGEIVDLKGFYIRGFSVEGSPVNGIQTRWVDGFEFANNDSVNNLNNGIYPTLSANGMVRNNVSYGSLDTAMWVAGSENVRVIGNELYGSVIGFEITVSNNVEVTANTIYDNTVGVGLFHPNGAGNPPLDVMANWVIEHNDIYDNNRPNGANPDTLQGKLLPGAGVLLVGVSDHVVAKNNIENNNYVGVGVLGWCTSGQDCSDLRGPPEAENNLISQNYLSGNGGEPPAEAPFPPADLLYIQYEVPAEESGNCFENNKPENELNTYAAYPPVFPPGDPPGQPLPTAGC
jgi:parallel beta-helix repeat protein